MKLGLSFLALFFCTLLLLIGTAFAEDITNPILKKLVEKGILTREEAISVMQELENEKIEKEKKAEGKIEQEVTKAVPEDTKDISMLAKVFKGFKFGGLWYLSYQNGEQGDRPILCWYRKAKGS